MFLVLVVLVKETTAKKVNTINLSGTRVAVQLLQHVYTLSSFSLSIEAPADLLVLNQVSESVGHKLGQPALKPVDRLQC